MMKEGAVGSWVKSRLAETNLGSSALEALEFVDQSMAQVRQDKGGIL